MDGIAGVRHQHAIAPVERGESQVRDAFLGAYGGDSFRFRIKIDVKARFVPVADGAAQARNAPRHRIAVRVVALNRFHKLGNDVRRRGAVGIAHAEIDDIVAATAGRHLELGGNVENVGGEPLNAGELLWQSPR